MANYLSEFNSSFSFDHIVVLQWNLESLQAYLYRWFSISISSEISTIQKYKKGSTFLVLPLV